MSGVRYKQYMVYVKRDENESMNSYTDRLWFTMKNVSKATYDQLISYSRYFVNIKQKGLKYQKAVHETIENTFNVWNPNRFTLPQ